MCQYRVALALGSRGEGRMAKDMNEKSLGRRVCGKQISRSHSNGAPQTCHCRRPIVFSKPIIYTVWRDIAGSLEPSTPAGSLLLTPQRWPRARSTTHTHPPRRSRLISFRLLSCKIKWLRFLQQNNFKPYFWLSEIASAASSTGRLGLKQHTDYILSPTTKAVVE